jgi:hypothetical protein
MESSYIFIFDGYHFSFTDGAEFTTVSSTDVGSEPRNPKKQKICRKLRLAIQKTAQ